MEYHLESKDSSCLWKPQNQRPFAFHPKPNTLAKRYQRTTAKWDGPHSPRRKKSLGEHKPKFSRLVEYPEALDESQQPRRLHIFGLNSEGLTPSNLYLFQLDRSQLLVYQIHPSFHSLF
jgi:hypothetical protein